MPHANMVLETRQTFTSQMNTFPSCIQCPAAAFHTQRMQTSHAQLRRKEQISRKSILVWKDGQGRHPHETMVAWQEQEEWALGQEGKTALDM